MRNELINIWATSRSGHNFVGQVIQSWLPYSRFKYLTNVMPKDLKYERVVPGSTTIYIRRRFDNFLASTLAAWGKDTLTSPSWPEGVGRRIKTYRLLEEFVMSPESENVIDLVINYERFCLSESYRRGLCAMLDGVYTEEMIDVVSTEGRGSSFDGFKYRGQGSKMKTHERATQILETKWAYIFNELLKEYEHN